MSRQTMATLATGESARIVGLVDNPGDPDGLLRLTELGLIPGQHVYLVKTAPLGDPIEIRIMNYDLCLRKREAAQILIEPISESKGGVS